MSFIDNWLKNAQYAVLGPRCALCRAPATLDCELCDDCRTELPRLGRTCLYCALALPADSATTVCASCACRPRFDAGHAVFAYRDPVRWLITQLKFHGRLSHARLLGDMLANQLVDVDALPPEVIVPVPLHSKGYRRRGFNQAERIAARLAHRLDRPLGHGLIERIRDTARQSELNADRRVANVRGAFVCPHTLVHRHVAIVDDVVTTTRTAAAVAAALRAAGAERVDLYCVARA